MNTTNFKHKEITDLIIKSFYEVYNELGSGFLESVYEKAMGIVLQQYNLKVEYQKGIAVYFRGKVVGEFRADLIVNDKVIVELKAVRSLEPGHEAQLINYLKATSMEVGMLMNFGHMPVFQRFAFDNNRKQAADFAADVRR